jgi:hypothetical protein
MTEVPKIGVKVFLRANRMTLEPIASFTNSTVDRVWDDLTKGAKTIHSNFVQQVITDFNITGSTTEPPQVERHTLETVDMVYYVMSFILTPQQYTNDLLGLRRAIHERLQRLVEDFINISTQRIAFAPSTPGWAAVLGKTAHVHTMPNMQRRVYASTSIWLVVWWKLILRAMGLDRQDTLVLSDV